MPTYSRSEFLARWRALRGYAPRRNNVPVADNSDLSLKLAAEMDEWYTRLLLEGDPSLLEPEEIAGETVLPPPEDECITLALPPGTMRVLSVRLSGWKVPARVINDPASAVVRRQEHPFTRACVTHPVALFTPDGELRLWPASSLDTLESLVCVICREGEYTMSSAALASVMRM